MSKVEMVVGEIKLQMGLDKFVLGIPYPTLPKHDEQNPPSQEQLANVAAKQKEFVSGMKHIESMIKIGAHHVSHTKNKDLKRYKVLSEIDGGLLCIFSLGFSYGTGVVNFEINPSRLTESKWDELLGFFSLWFHDHYDEIYTKGVVAHAEFYVDVSGEDLTNLTLIDEGRRAYTIHKGTTYLGRRKSALSATMYDKAKEQKKDGKLVRIETRICRRDIRFQDLVENDLFNPFSNCLVVNVNQLQSISNEWKNPQLANQIKEWGLFDAIANKHARKNMLARLKDVAVPWWKPELFWAVHRQLLLQFKPGHAGGFA